MPLKNPDSKIAVNATAAVHPHIFVTTAVSVDKINASSVARPTPIAV